MKLSDYYADQKPVHIKTISVIVIVAFLVTQLDIQLAFANTLPLSNIALSNISDKSADESKNVHYMQDLEKFLSESPLSQPTTSEPESKNETPEPLETPKSFFPLNPLTRPEGEVFIDESVQDQVRFSYKNGSSYA